MKTEKVKLNFELKVGSPEYHSFKKWCKDHKDISTRIHLLRGIKSECLNEWWKEYKSQSSVLSKEGEELKPMPDKDGWNFDYNILCDIEHVCTAKDEFVSLEAIDAILLSLHELGFTITRKTNPPKV